MVFSISTSTRQFKLRGFDFINYIFIQTQANLTGFMSKGVKNYMQLYGKN